MRLQQRFRQSQTLFGWRTSSSWVPALPSSKGASQQCCKSVMSLVLLQIPWSLGVYFSHLHLQQCSSALMCICYPLSQCQALASEYWRHIDWKRCCSWSQTAKDLCYPGQPHSQRERLSGYSWPAMVAFAAWQWIQQRLLMVDMAVPLCSPR